MRLIECLTGWGGGPSWFEVEADVGVADDDNEVDIVIIRLHTSTSPEEAELEVAPARIGMLVTWLEPTCAMTIPQARALRDALDDAINGIEGVD